MTLEQTILALVEERLPQLVAAEVERHQVTVEPIERMPEVMTTRMVAEVFDCTVQHVNNLARVGALQSKYDGNRRLYLREWVIDYVRSDRHLEGMSDADRARLRNRRYSSAGSSSAARQ